MELFEDVFRIFVSLFEQDKTFLKSLRDFEKLELEEKHALTQRGIGLYFLNRLLFCFSVM